jgi:transcriptional regulator with XRE-family HTH domain
MSRPAHSAAASPLYGRVAGALLATIRTYIGYTQDQLAERLNLSTNTLSTWERGTTPIANLSHVRLEQLRRRLLILGAPADLLRAWDSALRVDGVLAELAIPDPDEHPLAYTVPDRAMTELLAWPLTGAVPRALANVGAHLDVPRGERAAAAAALRAVADRATAQTERHAMLRRQVGYLLAGDPGSREWLAHHNGHHGFPAALDRWTPSWALARSAAVTAAAAGDLDPMRHFIDSGLATDLGRAANLRYWAYWVGEVAEVWHSDRAMTDAGTGGWSGEVLLASLLEGVVHAPYRDLSAETLWTLLRVRKRLASHPVWADRIRHAVCRALDDRLVGDPSARKLEAVHYTTEVA